MTILESINSSMNIRANSSGNNILGPEPKYILEQQFGLLKKGKSSNINHENEDVDQDDDDPSKYYSYGWNE
ncbi:hypothetical protein BLA29_014785, partial [Euroglyphus maynei]